MSGYKNIFFNDNINNLVGIDIPLDSVIVKDDTETDGVSQAVEFDILHGHVYRNAFHTPAYVEAPMIYEQSLNGARDIAMSIQTDAELVNRNRGERSAFIILFNNYLKTCVLDEGLSNGRNKKRFWYSLEGATITKLTPSHGYGLNLSHHKLLRNGRLEQAEGYGFLPNIYGGGQTCHGNLSELQSWRNNVGAVEDEPRDLGKSFELFKSGVGNDDLVGSNMTKPISNGFMIDIVDELMENYVRHIPSDIVRERMTDYIETYMEGLEAGGRSTSVTYSINQLSAILTHTDKYFIEDYV